MDHVCNFIRIVVSVMLFSSCKKTVSQPTDALEYAMDMNLILSELLHLLPLLLEPEQLFPGGMKVSPTGTMVVKPN